MSPQRNVPTRKSPGRAGFFNHPAVLLFLVATFGVVAYSNTFSAPFTFDDESSIVHNSIIHSLDNFLFNTDGYHHQPNRYVGYLSFALNYGIGGLDVTGYHVFNLTIHILNAILVYFLASALFQTRRMQGAIVSVHQKSIAAMAALLFVVHPIQTQAVTYIVQRLTSLATFFYLLSVLLYSKARTSCEEGTFPKGKQILIYLLSLLSAVMAMKTKEIAFTLPFIVVLYEFMFFKEDARKRIPWIFPFLLTILIIPLAVLSMDKSLGEILSDASEASRANSPLTRWEYLLTQFRVIMTYLRLLILPVGQNIDYDYPVSRHLLSPKTLASLFGIIGFIAVGVFSFLRYRKNSDGNLLLISFGVFWALITLSVESSVIPITDVIFEHRVYLPSFGLFLLSTVLIMILAEKYLPDGKRHFMYYAFFLLLILLSAATYRRNALWSDKVALWEDAVSKSPRKARAYNNLGSALEERGRLSDARRFFETALELDPEMELAHNNLGLLYGKEGSIENAIQHFQAAIRANPEYANAYNNLGFSYMKIGMLDDAIAQHSIAIRLDPYHADAHRNLGILYGRKGLLESAIFHLEKSIQLNPFDAIAHNNLGVLFMKAGSIDRALPHFSAAVRLDPGNQVFRNNWNRTIEKANQPYP